MIDFAPLPQSAVLPVDCHIGATETILAAIQFTNLVDNLPPLPTK